MQPSSNGLMVIIQCATDFLRHLRLCRNSGSQNHTAYHCKNKKFNIHDSHLSVRFIYIKFIRLIQTAQKKSVKGANQSLKQKKVRQMNSGRTYLYKFILLKKSFL